MKRNPHAFRTIPSNKARQYPSRTTLNKTPDIQPAHQTLHGNRPIHLLNKQPRNNVTDCVRMNGLAGRARHKRNARLKRICFGKSSLNFFENRI